MMVDVVRVLRETKLSKILLVRDRPGHTVVWKEPFSSTSYKTEVKALRIMKGDPDIIRLKDTKRIGDSKFIEMEYIDGMNLEELLMARKFLSESEARAIFGRLALAILRCHRKEVHHGDVKLANVMIICPSSSVINDFELKLIDFGGSFIGSPHIKHHSARGTPDWVPPEMIAHEPYLVPKVDVYSLGVVLFALLVGRNPFLMSERIAAVKESQSHPPLVYPESISISDEVKDLISKMMEYDPDKRLSMDEVVAHPWLKDENLPVLPQRSNGLLHSLKTLFL